MKSVRLALINKKFDDQYTLSLQGYFSIQDFCSTLSLFNQAVRQHPPPGNKAVYAGALIAVWLFAGAAASAAWTQFQSRYALLLLPVLMVFSIMLVVWRHRAKRLKFECNILEICSRINATENIRGISFRFSKNEPCMTRFPLKAYYAIVIEFDDRYSALIRQSFSDDFVSIALKPSMPPPAHVTEKDMSMFYNYYDSYLDEKKPLAV